MYFSWVSTIQQCETRGGASPPTFRQDNAFERVRVSLAPTLPVFVYVGARPGRRRLLTLPPLAGGLPPARSCVPLADAVRDREAAMMQLV